MADSDPGERNYDNMLKMLSDLNKDLEKLLEEMEKISGRVFSPLFPEVKFFLHFWAQTNCLNKVFLDHLSASTPCNCSTTESDLSTKERLAVFSDSFMCVCSLFLRLDSSEGRNGDFFFVTGHSTRPKLKYLANAKQYNTCEQN